MTFLEDFPPFQLLFFVGWALFFYILGLLDSPRIRSLCEKSSDQSPPASVTGHPGLPDRTAQSPPVAGDGGETG